MNIFLILAFLFAIGSFIGWCIEVIFRRIVSKSWMNPGYLAGPWLPIYGFSLCVLYCLTLLESYIPVQSYLGKKLILFIIMAIAITAIEYAAGLIFIKGMKIKLWDYSDMWGNINGIICPRFSFYWMILSAIYYFAVHPHILDMLNWLSKNLAFSFCIGFYFGVMDLVYSSRIVYHIKRFAEEQQIIIRLEELKENVKEYKKKQGERLCFILSFHSRISLREHLECYIKTPDFKKSVDEFRKIKKK